jgi:hypothetical protein
MNRAIIAFSSGLPPVSIDFQLVGSNTFTSQLGIIGFGNNFVTPDLINIEDNVVVSNPTFSFHIPSGVNIFSLRMTITNPQVSQPGPIDYIAILYRETSPSSNEYEIIGSATVSTVGSPPSPILLITSLNIDVTQTNRFLVGLVLRLFINNVITFTGNISATIGYRVTI